MKKLFMIAVILISANLSAQVKYSDFYIKQNINGVVEIDGHCSKKGFRFTASFKGIFIYDIDDKEYIFKECYKKKCKIIHLEPKSTGIILYPNRYLISKQ